jgi:[NiFe] hydrogenase diaphorase moiety large subunit
MLLTEQDQLKKDIFDWVAKYGRGRSALLPVLQEIQRKQSHVSPFAMQIVADLLGIHPVEVYSVVSFYAFFDESPKGKFIIRLCRTISCDMVENLRVARQLENDLGISFGQTTPDGKFTLEWTNCLGMCDQGPAMMVNDIIYTRMNPARVQEILDSCRRSVSVKASGTKMEVHQ